MKVETAAGRGDISTVYRPIKQLCRLFNASISIVNEKKRAK